jgi:hypothetical protein
MTTMGRLQFGRLTEAWKGEASDFTPLLSERLDQLGAAIGVELATLGRSEVATAGGRRIDIVAQDADGADFVIENQYGRADHDHLTRGLAYAVAAKARGLVVVAEEHRDEFKAVARYLNDLRDAEPTLGIAVWLVEARAVRVDESAWAPLFTAVVEPNDFVTTVEQTKPPENRPLALIEDFWALIADAERLSVTRRLVESWRTAGHRLRLGPNHVVLEANGPSVSGVRTVVAVYADGRVLVPFSSYAGSNSGIEVAELTTDTFRAEADALFGFQGSERQARTAPGWLRVETLHGLQVFAARVAAAYARAGTEQAST